MIAQRLDNGESRWRLHTGPADSVDQLYSRPLVEKVYRDWQAGELDFLQKYYLEIIARAREDSFTATRYKIVTEAEALAPHSEWHLDHLTKLSGDYGHALELLKEYDDLRSSKKKAEIVRGSHTRGEKPKGKEEKPAFHHPMVPDIEAIVRITLEEYTNKLEPITLARFHGLERYLWLLHWHYYKTNYEKAEDAWIELACDLHVKGELVNLKPGFGGSGTNFIEAADNILRYKGWEKTNREDYYESLRRLSRTKQAHEKFVRELKERIPIFKPLNTY
jgi:hypothetical protein